MSSPLKDRTAVAIAHRLTTVCGTDRIYVIAAGAVVEQGRRAELAAGGGLYQRLCERQFAAP